MRLSNCKPGFYSEGFEDISHGYYRAVANSFLDGKAA